MFLFTFIFNELVQTEKYTTSFRPTKPIMDKNNSFNSFQ